MNKTKRIEAKSSVKYNVDVAVVLVRVPFKPLSYYVAEVLEIFWWTLNEKHIWIPKQQQHDLKKTYEISKQ